jgi:hypothetical protein
MAFPRSDSSERWNPEVSGIACDDGLKSYDAAPAPRAAYFSLLVQRKVGKRKHTRSLAALRAVPCAPRLDRARAELAER